MLKYFKKLKLVFLSKTKPIKFARYLGVCVGGRCRFLSVNMSTFGSEPFLISIGEHVTITSGVKFVTHDGGVWVFRDVEPKLDVFGKITVGDNVFIGLNSIILPNTKIGPNVVIGAGSIVKGDLESNSVYAGIPARKICSLEEYRSKLSGRELYTKGLDTKSKRKIILQNIGHK
jgi:acetyltransferase-like isoleucine patch superfamily enzyme